MMDKVYILWKTYKEIGIQKYSVKTQRKKQRRIIMNIAEKINSMNLRKVRVDEKYGLVFAYGTDNQLAELEKYCQENNITCELNTWFSEDHKLEIIL